MFSRFLTRWKVKRNKRAHILSQDGRTQSWATLVINQTVDGCPNSTTKAVQPLEEKTSSLVENHDHSNPNARDVMLGVQSIKSEINIADPAPESSRRQASRALDDAHSAEVQIIHGGADSTRDDGADRPWDDRESRLPPQHRRDSEKGISKRSRKKRRKISPKALYNMRSSALRQRINLRDTRKYLSQQRSLATDADVKFIRAVQVLVAENPTLLAGHVLDLYEECQKIRDRCQPLEDDYNAAEKVADGEDYQLIEMEKMMVSEGFNDVESEESGGEGSLIASTDAADSHVNFEDYPPLLVEYYSKKGDVDMLLERLDDLRETRAGYVNQQIHRESLNIAPNSESLEFLADYQRIHDQTQAELDDARVKASALRRSCEEAGYLDPHDSQEADYEEEDEELNLRANVSGRDPLFLQNAEEEMRFSELRPGPAGTALNRAEFVDQWLLLGMRTSAMEIRRFKSTSDLQGLQIQPERLKTLVLEWWPKDHASEGLISALLRDGKSISIARQTKEESEGAASLDLPRRPRWNRDQERVSRPHVSV